MNDLEEAIKRSVSHNETIRLEVADRYETLVEVELVDGVDDVDYHVEDNGELDVWGEFNGESFRLRIA